MPSQPAILYTSVGYLVDLLFLPSQVFMVSGECLVGAQPGRGRRWGSLDEASVGSVCPWGGAWCPKGAS